MGVPHWDLSSRLEEERLTNLLGWSRSFKEGREGAGERSSLDEEDAGLLRFPREILDMRLNQDEPDGGSFRSVNESLSDAQGLNMTLLLIELSRDSVPVPVLSIAEGVLALTVFLRRTDADKRRSSLSDNAGVEVTG